MWQLIALGAHLGLHLKVGKARGRTFGMKNEGGVPDKNRLLKN
jgi:hypothetical protein